MPPGDHAGEALADARHRAVAEGHGVALQAPDVVLALARRDIGGDQLGLQAGDVGGNLAGRILLDEIQGLQEFVEFFVADEIAGPDGPLAEYGLVSDPELAATQEAVAAGTTMQ